MPADDDGVDRLYGVALEEFVAERDALAKSLRRDGRRDAAKEIKALTKPTVGAWAANQAVRARRRESQALWDAGDALHAAQAALLAGSGDAAALRGAQEREQAALAPLVEAARGLLTGTGRTLSDDVLERVRETLHAAALDPGQREAAAAGRLTRELSYAGMGLGGAAPVAPARPAPRRGPRRAAPAEPPASDRDESPAAPAPRSPPGRRAARARSAEGEQAAREHAER